MEPKAPNGIHEDYAAIRESVDRVAALNYEILPGHDAGVFDL
jgi:hypothetical protein